MQIEFLGQILFFSPPISYKGKWSRSKRPVNRKNNKRGFKDERKVSVSSHYLRFFHIYVQSTTNREFNRLLISYFLKLQ